MEFPKLGSFDLNSIPGLDSLRNINIEDLKDSIKHSKLELLAVVIFLIALVCIGFLSHAATASAKALEVEKLALQEKAEPIKKYKEVIKNQEVFLNSLPPALADNNFITVLTDIATKRGVRITDFTPPVVKEDRYFRKLTSKFACTAPEFSNAILFINDLEQSTYAIKLDNWAMRLQVNKPKAGVSGKVEQSVSSVFMMDLTISSIKIETETKVKSTKNEQ